jgi:hypothetical protein
MTDEHLAATIEPAADGGPEGELPIVLRIVNGSGEPVELANPDMGQPSPQMGWPFSIEAYRASLLISYGYLSVSLIDEWGEEVEPDRVETWATPAMRPPITLAPGESIELIIPVARLFPVSAGTRYRVLVEYGDGAQKVRAERTIKMAKS